MNSNTTRQADEKPTRYQIERGATGWIVVTTANGEVVGRVCRTRREAQSQMDAFEHLPDIQRRG